MAVDLATRLQGLAESSTAMVLKGTVEDAGDVATKGLLSSLLGKPDVVSVKSFGDVVVVRMSVREDLPPEQGSQ